MVVCTNAGTKVFGTSLELHGGQAEAVAVPAADASVVKIPEGITVEQAVLLTDILPTGYLGAQRADITPGDTVVVIGLGPVGVFALQCAQLYGPSRILAVDMVPDRLARAEELGAEPIDASGGDTVAKVYEATGGRGAESVIEAVGADQSVNDAILCAAPGGTISVIGVNLNFAFPFPVPVALMKRLTFRVTLAAIPTTWPALFPLVASGKLKPGAGVHAPARPLRRRRGVPHLRCPRGRRAEGAAGPSVVGRATPPGRGRRSELPSGHGRSARLEDIVGAGTCSPATPSPTTTRTTRPSPPHRRCRSPSCARPTPARWPRSWRWASEHAGARSPPAGPAPACRARASRGPTGSSCRSSAWPRSSRSTTPTTSRWCSPASRSTSSTRR